MWMINWNEGNRAANGRGRLPSPRFVGKTVYAPAVGASQLFAGVFAGANFFEISRRDSRPCMMPWTCPDFFSDERFSDGVAVRFADVTTCYPGQPPLGATAHDGVVRNRHEVGKRARPTYQPAMTAKKLNGPRAVFRKVLWGGKEHSSQPLRFKPGSSPTRVVRGCAGPSASATGQ